MAYRSSDTLYCTRPTYRQIHFIVQGLPIVRHFIVQVVRYTLLYKAYLSPDTFYCTGLTYRQTLYCTSSQIHFIVQVVTYTLLYKTYLSGTRRLKKKKTTLRTTTTAATFIGSNQEPPLLTLSLAILSSSAFLFDVVTGGVTVATVSDSSLQVSSVFCETCSTDRDGTLITVSTLKKIVMLIVVDDNIDDGVDR